MRWQRKQVNHSDYAHETAAKGDKKEGEFEETGAGFYCAHKSG